MSKFTAGPWNWVARSEYIGGVYHQLENSKGMVIHTDGSACGEYNPDIDVTSADAHLIAAAPELYDALEFALHRLESVESPIFSVRHAIQKCKSAIAKAHGHN